MNIEFDSSLANDDDDVILRPNTTSTLSTFSCFIIFINGFLGVGFFYNSRHFRCGLIFTTIVNFIVAFLAYYGSWMLIYAMKIRKTTYFETIWKASGYKATFLISLFIAAPCLGYTANDMSHMNYAFKTFIQSVFVDAPTWLTDPYLFNFFLIFIVYLPSSWRHDLKALQIFSFIKLFIVTTLIILCIYWCCIGIKEDGFDPNNQVTMFNFSEDFVLCASELIGTYVSYPFIFVVLNAMHNLTYNRAKSTIKSSFITFSLLLEVVGIFQYFTLYNIEIETPFLYLLDNSQLSVKIGLATYILYYVCTLPVFIEPMRLSSIFIVSITEDLPQFTWSSMEIIWLLTASLFSTLTNSYISLLTTLLTIASLIMQFITPPLMLYKVMYTLPKYHWIAIILFIILGCIFSIYLLVSIYYIF
ncbi:hypothetical protein TRFO_35708 [Tritrichomonas foetus]|uniref:Transmembrane amino acid transporter protein n=1 Tax=Tritrichomonas foetus TaxID=1144522 RepID=A0A1J4JGY0_9EUKA|nr:hypothetical protein TRFO_35708 [Tritrichomonas foetus]|eukprot:OHS97945.1 hypothetical protein TRFO_35708 [Tritrichomonas foetus]